MLNKYYSSALMFEFSLNNRDMAFIDKVTEVLKFYLNFLLYLYILLKAYYLYFLKKCLKYIFLSSLCKLYIYTVVFVSLRPLFSNFFIYIYYKSKIFI